MHVRGVGCGVLVSGVGYGAVFCVRRRVFGAVFWTLAWNTMLGVVCCGAVG